MVFVLRGTDGSVVTDESRRWFRDATRGERDLLATLGGPVLDVGCGPGRLVAALLEQGTPSLGVDIAPAAVDLTRRRGGSAIVRSVFDPLPAEGRWGAAVLADGNIGIGGDPHALLERVAELVRPGGEIAVEVDHDGRGLRRVDARIERDGETSAWFAWATADDAAVRTAGAQVGLRHDRRHDVDGDRAFTILRRPVAA